MFRGKLFGIMVVGVGVLAMACGVVASPTSTTTPTTPAENWVRITPGEVITPIENSAVTPESVRAPTPSPTPSPTPVVTQEPTPLPQVDWSLCQPGDSYDEAGKTLYVSSDIGVKRRTFPDLSSSYNGGASQNTKLVVECKRGSWYRVSDNQGSFWILEEWTSGEPTVSPPVYTQPLPPPVVNPGGGNKIVLTFDDSDGSGVLVSQILDILARYGVKAIFFPTGNWANGSGAPYVQRMLAEGHLVCNHTRDHADLTTLSKDGIVEQILGGAGVGSCNLLRPPYGAYNSYVASIAAELGYSIYMWSIDTMDWNRRYAGGDQEILNIALSQAYPGAVILMHMHVENTVRALPAMIEGLQAAGYQLHW